jgi:hypothetical protein
MLTRAERDQFQTSASRAASQLTQAASVYLSMLFVLAFSMSAYAQSYAPVGPQENVPVSTVTSGGWTECFKEKFDQNTPISTILAACSGTQMMMACRPTGSATLQLLAQAAKSDVTFPTGYFDRYSTRLANGSLWYFDNNWSWGFAQAGDSVDKYSCDWLSTGASSKKMCIHTGSNQTSYGYRCGNSFPGSNYERVFYSSAGGATPALTVTSAANHSGSGNQGGAFSGSPASYTVQNSGTGTLNWTVSGPSWLSFSATSGSLGAGASTIVTVSYNATANSLPAGVQTGTISFGGNGGAATRSASLTVNDITPPVWSNTPASITVFTPANSATATATWTPPTASDNVGVTSSGSNFAPGASFPVGTTTVTYTASDAASNVRTTSFTVTVIDNVAPVISGTPANITIEATGPTGAAVSYIMPTANDNVNGPVTVSTTNASGSIFPIGTTTVTFTASDAALNSSTTTFQVTVRDTTAPALSGVPSDLMLEATSPTGATLNYTLPTAADIVDGARTVTTNFAPGAVVPFSAPGPTVTVVTFSASDLATPANTAGASFNVTVRDTTAPVLAGVPANITAEAANASGAVVTYSPASASDIADTSPTITYSRASGSIFPIGKTTVTVTATDASNNVSTSTFDVTVRDTTAPVLSGVPADMAVEATSASGAIVTYAAASAADAVDPAPTVSSSPVSGATFPLGTTTVTVTAADSASNVSTATFTVTVQDTTAPVISGTPANITIEATGPGGAPVSYVPPTANDLVDGPVTVSTTNASGSTFPVGTTTVTFTATDARMNSSTTTFQVTVTDATAPVISGVPANVVLEATSPAGAAYTYAMPTATDIVDGTRPVSTSHPSGSTFPFAAPGPTVTSVTFSASDLATPLNTAGASFTVTVQDTTAPVLSGVPANITAEATGASGATVTYAAASASDAADASPTITYSHASGATFPIGTTTVTVTATDDTGNAATATFTVSVGDTTAPTIGAVSNVTVTAPDLVGAAVTFALPSATDAVDAAPAVSAAPASGAFFAIGSHTVTVTATDASGNAATKTFTVTVLTPATMAVTPNTVFTSTGPQGQQGAPFSHLLQAYSVTNNGEVPMTYAVTGAPAWVTLTNSSGTIPAGGNATVTVALNAAADALGVAVHAATLAFTNSTSGIGNTTRGVTLTVVAPAAMTVSPANGLVSAGPQGQQGGAFTPASQSFTVSNGGALPMNYAVSGAPAWISLTNASGTIPAGGSATVTTSLNAAANALGVAVHTGTLTFTNQTNGNGTTTRPVSLDVRNPAQIAMTPPEGLTASGFQGGPFSPASKVYTLNNPGAYPVNFTASANQSWLTAAPASGTIPAGGSANVTLSINAGANALQSATHTGALTVTNTTNGLGTASRSAALTVIPNGQVVVRVETQEGDGTFNFTSATSSLNLNVTTSSGSGQSAAITLNPGAYSVAVALPQGFGLTGVSCNDSNSTGDVAGKSASIVLASAETVTCTFRAANSRKKTVEVIEQFMGQRNDMLLTHGPDLMGRFRFGATSDYSAIRDSDDVNEAGQSGAQSLLAATGTQPFTASRAVNAQTQDILNKAMTSFGRDTMRDENETGFYPEEDGIRRLSNDGDTNSFSFAASMNQFMRWAGASAAGEAYAKTPEAQAKAQANWSRFDIWIQGHGAKFSDDRAGTDSDGHFGVVYFGADYFVRPWLLVGVLAQADTMKQESATDSFSIEGTGWMAGPYAVARLNDQMFLETRAAWGTSDNEVSPFLTYTDSFGSERWLVSSTLTGAFQKNQWLFRPSASLAYIEDVSDAYVDSLGVPIPSVRTALGQFRAEPEISYAYKLSSGTILEPKLGAAVIWNFESSGTAANFGGTMSGPEETRGKVNGGMSARFVGGTIVDLEASYDGLGSDNYHAASGQVTVRVPIN